ncbi:hypothetical protein K469DRAFT_704373, partial [Zopfia rhizophila CBS 207.26]
MPRSPSLEGTYQKERSLSATMMTATKLLISRPHTAPPQPAFAMLMTYARVAVTCPHSAPNSAALAVIGTLA